MQRPKTLFIDIDGVLLKHHGEGASGQFLREPELLPGVLETLDIWEKMGHVVILTTGRRESYRKRTEEQLQQVGIVYDQLVMGCGGGERVVINDAKPKSNESTCAAYTLPRNTGIPRGCGTPLPLGLIGL